MILGINELLRLVKEENLIEGLSERELKTPEGTGFDLVRGADRVLYNLYHIMEQQEE